MTILYDSKFALQAVANLTSKSGQQVIYEILRAERTLQVQDTSIRLQWIPGHSNDPGNDATNQLAKQQPL